MTKEEILSMLKTAKDKESLKKMWFRMAMKLHPDKGGDEEIFKFASNEYESLFSRLKDGFKRSEKEHYEESPNEDELSEMLFELLMKYSRISMLNVELCGSWIWITGDTKPHSDEFKEDHFMWSPKKSAWYFHEGKYRKRGKKHYSLEEIRMMHGSRFYKTKEKEEIK